jgi:chaperonin GroEL
MQFDRGYISPYFVTNAEKIRGSAQPGLRKEALRTQRVTVALEAVERTAKPLLIIAEDVERCACHSGGHGLKVAAVKAPGFGDRRKAILVSRSGPDL